MEKISFKPYAWKCVLGTEVAYALCLAGGFLPIRNIEAVKLHHLLFETLPGFTWINATSVIIGVVYMFAFAWIFAGYYVWMHNSSLVKSG